MHHSFYNPSDEDQAFDLRCMAEDLTDPTAIERLAAHAPTGDEADAMRAFAAAMRKYRGQLPRRFRGAVTQETNRCLGL